MMEWQAAGNTAEFEDSTNLYMFEQQESGLKPWNVPVAVKCLGAVGIYGDKMTAVVTTSISLDTYYWMHDG